LDSKTLTRSARSAVLLVGLGVLASVGVAFPLEAQTTEQRRQLDAFSDSLEAVTDSTTLHGQEARLLLVARQSKTDPLLHLRLGDLALRRGDLGGASHYDDAASEFKWATELAPKWPYAFYGLGLAEFALGDRVAGNGERRPELAREAWSRATQAFARAASLEPAFAVRLEELARRAVRERAPDKAQVVREALRRASLDQRGVRAGRLVLALARVQRETDDSGALSSFEAYLASGDDPALASLELGRTRLERGDLSGAALYLEGATEDDPVAVAEYRADLSPLAGEAELADFDLRRGPAREEMLRRFWYIRDRLELRADGERLAEHLRRMAFARREFLLVAADGTERLDDRGRIYVRHGEPDDRASFSIPGVEPNESWRYRRGGADMVLHFVAKQAPNDFRLVESVLDVSDGRSVLGASTSSPSGSAGGASAEQLLRSRSALSTLYQQAPMGRPEQTADYLARERALGRRGIQVGTLSDSYTLRFARDLDAWGTLLVAGGSGAQPAIQVLFAIPGYAVEPATGVAGVVYPVRVRFVALDPAGTVVASIDTITRLEPGDRIAANRSLLGRVSVPIRPGRIIAQAAVQYGDHGGTAFGIDTLAVPSPGSGEFALGDLLVGSPRGRLAVPLGDGSSILLAPGGVAHRSDGVDLAVEIFGLEPGGVANLRLYVAPREGPDAGPPDAPRWRLFPDAPAESRVTRGAGSGAITRWRIALPLKRLKPGSWTVAVVATDPAGRMARREARLEVQTP
jgi:GWxTD domain-containing protein